MAGHPHPPKPLAYILPHAPAPTLFCTCTSSFLCSLEMMQIRVPYYLTPSLSPAGLTPIPLPTAYPLPHLPHSSALSSLPIRVWFAKKAYPPNPSTAPPPLRSRHLPTPSPLSTALPVHLPLPPSLPPVPHPPPCSTPPVLAPPLPHTLPQKNLVSFFFVLSQKAHIGRDREGSATGATGSAADPASSVHRAARDLARRPFGTRTRFAPIARKRPCSARQCFANF